METIFDDIGDGERGNRSREYWWNYAIHAGKIVIDGAYRDETEAVKFGYQHIPCQFETICLATKDKAKSTSIIKRKVWGEGADMQFALQRPKHTSHKSDKKEGLL